MATMEPTTSRPRRRRLARSGDDRILTGAAGGLGEWLGIDPVVVRLAFGVLSLAGGAGIVLYLAVALVSAPPGPPELSRPRTSSRQAVAVGMVVTGVMVLLRDLGLWLGDSIVWPASLAALGSAVIWTRGDDTDRARWRRLLTRLPGSRDDAGTGGAWPVQIVVGGLLVLAGFVAFLSTESVSTLGTAPAAVGAAAVGLAVIAVPGLWRLVRDLGRERRERIRHEERAELAAHLHDSVLQTLALIQRTADRREVIGLARAQERELRTWLFGGATPKGGPDQLRRAIDQAAAEVERAHGTEVDVVVVGDRPLDEPLRAMVEALREAMVNSARHSGGGEVAVYVEVEPQSVSAYVRDQGVGFDRSQVPADRRGIADSIERRMHRNGGGAQVLTEPGRGTEVRLRLPLGRP